MYRPRYPSNLEDKHVLKQQKFQIDCNFPFLRRGAYIIVIGSTCLPCPFSLQLYRPLFQLLRSPAISKKLGDVHSFHLKRHQKQGEEERLRRRNAPLTPMGKRNSKTKLAATRARLSTEVPWRIREGVVRHLANPYVAVATLAKVIAKN
jgi:hypothetical protein